MSLQMKCKSCGNTVTPRWKSDGYRCCGEFMEFKTPCNNCNKPHPNNVYLWDNELESLELCFTCLCGICFIELGGPFR